jgi:hypothetical protein
MTALAETDQVALVALAAVAVEKSPDTEHPTHWVLVVLVQQTKD